MSEIVCPTGFVIPDNPDHPLVEYVNRTCTEYGDCAFSCVSHPRYTPEQYDMIFTIRLCSVIFTGTIAFIAVNLWSMDRKNYGNNFFVILYACSMCVSSSMLGFAFIPGRAKRFCEDNAVPIYDHPQSACSTEGFGMLAGVMVIGFCWCFQSWDLFKRIILGR